MATYDIMEKSRALRQDMSLRNLFELTCAYGSVPAAVEWVQERESVVTYGEYREWTQRYGAYLRGALEGHKRGSFVGVSLDTCKEWFPTFWGLIQAGYNALLLDANLPDEMVAYLLGQAGSRALITQKPRQLEGVQIIDTQALFNAPDAPDFTPEYGNSVALCTSGTTSTSRIFVYNGQAISEQVLSSQLLYQENRRLIDNRNMRVLAFLPYHHVLGFLANLLWVGFVGYTNVYLKDRSPTTIVQTARNCRVEMMITVPLLANNRAPPSAEGGQGELPQARLFSDEGLSRGSRRGLRCGRRENVIFKAWWKTPRRSSRW